MSIFLIQLNLNQFVLIFFFGASADGWFIQQSTLGPPSHASGTEKKEKIQIEKTRPEEGREGKKVKNRITWLRTLPWLADRW